MSNDTNQIHFAGVCNPPGASVEEETTYMNEQQLQVAASHLEGLPVYIEHFKTLEDGTPIPPSGNVIMGFVAPKTGELCAAFTLNDGPTGKLAKRYLGEKVEVSSRPLQNILPDPELIKMTDLSLGYDVAFAKGPDGRELPIANRINELSICVQGARENTKIKLRIDAGKKEITPFNPEKEQQQERPSKQIKTYHKSPLEQINDHVRHTSKTYFDAMGRPDPLSRIRNKKL